MRNFMEAYAAVHNQEAREEASSSRDCISEMNLSSLTDNDLNEIVEEVLEDIFDAGFSVNEAYNIFADMFVESEIVGRQQKIDRLCAALNTGFDLVESKSAVTAIEEFRKHRHGKKLQETWSDKFNQDKRIQKQHSAVVAAESLNVRNLLVQLFNEKSGSKPDYIDADGDGDKKESMKKAFKDKEENPAKEEEKLRKDDDLFGSPNKKKKTVKEGMKQARKNVGASTCWDGYKAKGTKKKGGKEVPNCVKEDQGPEVAPTGSARSKKKSYDPASNKGIDNSTGKKVGRVQAEETITEKDGLYANIHAKRARGEKMRSKGDEGAPTDKAFRDSAKTAKKEEVTYEGAGYNTYGAASPKQHASQMKAMAGASNRKVQVGKSQAALNRPMKNKAAAKMEDLQWSQDEIDAINAKVASWNEEGPAHPYETKAQAKAQKDHRQGKSSKGIKTGVNAPSYEASRTQGANRTN